MTFYQEVAAAHFTSFFEGLVRDAILRARDGAQRGRSGREVPFLVGSTVIGWDGVMPPYHLITPHFSISAPAANFKPSRDSRTLCAEQAAIAEMIRRTTPNILAVVVAGNVQPDDESGFVSPTLHPCGSCRRMMRALPEIADSTIIVTTGLDDNSPIEQHTLAELLALHSPRPA